MKFVKKDGSTVSGSLAYKIISASAKYKVKQEQKSIIFAKNAFVGYKLFVPPANAAQLGAFTLDYQFLYQPGGKSHWQVLSAHDTIESGGYIKFRLMGSHPAHVYVFNLDSGGNVYTLFPNPKIDYNNPLKGGKKYSFPKTETQAFQVDKVTGIEEFVIMVFRQKPPMIDKLLEKIRKGMKKQQFKQDDTVMRTRGVGKIVQIKTKKKTKRLGFKHTVTQIKGLATDYKRVFVLKHE